MEIVSSPKFPTDKFTSGVVAQSVAAFSNMLVPWNAPQNIVGSVSLKDANTILVAPNSVWIFSGSLVMQASYAWSFFEQAECHFWDPNLNSVLGVGLSKFNYTSGGETRQVIQNFYGVLVKAGPTGELQCRFNVTGAAKSFNMTCAAQRIS